MASPFALGAQIADRSEASTEISSSAGSALAEQVTSCFLEFRGLVYAYIFSVCGAACDAEELTQEVFLRLYSHLRAGNKIRNLRSWIFQVAHNTTLNHLKSRKREVPFDTAREKERFREPQDASPNPEELIQENQRTRWLSAGMKSLTDHQRRCLHLRAEGFRYREIADILGVSQWSVSDALDRSLTKLRRCRECLPSGGHS